MAGNTTRRRAMAAGTAFAAATLGPRQAFGQPGAPPKFELGRFIEDVIAADREADAQLAVEQVLARVMSNPADVMLAVGEPSTVGPQPIYKSANLSILNVVWSPLMVLQPHNHLMWATIGIYTGREDNIIWERRGGVVEASSAASLSEREVYSLPDNVIHSVTNPIPRLTGAIHIYGGDFFATQRSEWDPETLIERPQDFEAVQRQFRDANARFQESRR